ncbi:uncharacterized protein LOC112082796 [Eutrema salsugineum]|uniref:uncharacterized protein LOC112082796 n=1 Tax=Eutrema salsugineum TaxID=72664 RepID=UPI000CED1E4A|nr:uncharacterized protein LOC112082796 [Eutrema salsugineum]
MGASALFGLTCSLGPLFDHMGQDGPRRMGIPLQSKVIDACHSGSWKLPGPRSRLPSLVSVRQTLMVTPTPSILGGPDVYLWETPNGWRSSFSSSKTWEAIRPSGDAVGWEKLVWFKGHAPKHAFTFWTAQRNRLPKARLVRWGVSPNDLCCTCAQAAETRDHLLLNCDFSSQVWRRVMQKLGQPFFSFVDWSHFISWLSRRAASAPKLLRRLVSQVAVYSIWHERNVRLHAGIASTPVSLMKLIDRQVRDILLARNRKKPTSLLSLWFTYN